MAFWKRKEPKADPVVEETARRLVEAANKVLSQRESLAPAKAADYPGVDRAFYEATTTELTAQGAALLGDFQDVNTADRPADQRSFYRLALTADRTSLLTWFSTAQRIDNQPRVCCLVVHSWLDDGRVVLTSRGGASSSMFAEPPDLVIEHCPDSEPAAGVIARHARRTEASGCRARLLGDVTAIFSARDALAERVAAFRRSQGTGFYERALKGLLGDQFAERGPALMAAIGRHPEWTAVALRPLAAGQVTPANGAQGGILTDSTLTHPSQLGIPIGLLSDPKAFELVRIWSANDHQLLMMNVSPYRDSPEVWGVLALDMMKHAARAYQDFDGRSKEEAYRQILAGFSTEMQHPTEPL